MKSFAKAFIVFFIVAFVVSFFYSYTKRTLNTSTAQARYNGTNFTMIVPAGSTPVTLKNTTKPVGEQQMVQNAYSFQNGSVSYSVFAYEYSNHAEKTPEEVTRTTVSHLFNDGYSATFSGSHLGELSAVASEVEGTTIKGKAAFIRTRLAFSDDRKCGWMAIIVAPDRKSFPTAQVEGFMDSIQINSR